MKLHQFFEARQMKDPTRDSMVSKNGKVIVIDKDLLPDFISQGWELAEGAWGRADQEWDDSNVWDKESDRWFYSIFGDDDEAKYEDWMTAFAQCEPGSKECDILLTHEVFSNMLSDGPLDEFDDLYKAYDEGKADENMIRKYQELAKGYLGEAYPYYKTDEYERAHKEKYKKINKIRSDLAKKLADEDVDVDYKDFEPATNMCPDCEGEGKRDGKACERCHGAGEVFEAEVDYKNMKAGEFAKAHGDQWRKKKPVVRSTKKDKLVSLKVAKEEKYPQSLLLKGNKDAAKKSKAERQKDKDTKLKLAKKETDYSMPRSKREKEQAKNSATNEFTPDHIHNAMMKRVKAYDKTRKTEGLLQQFEPEYSEAKRKLGNEIRAKLGMKQLPELDWKKDMEMKHSRTALKARFAEGEERSIISDATAQYLIDMFGGQNWKIYADDKEELEARIYSEIESLDVEDVVNSEEEVGGQRIGNFASGRLLDVIDSSSVIDDVMQRVEEDKKSYKWTCKDCGAEDNKTDLCKSCGSPRKYHVEIDGVGEGAVSNPESYSREENQVSAILGKALGKSPGEALRYAPQELFSELESVNPELADSIASISRIVYSVKLEEKYDGYYLHQDAMKLWLDDNPGKTARDWKYIGVDVQDEYTEKAGGKKGKYLGKGASEWTRTDRFGSDSTWTRTKEIGEKLRKSTLPKITQADKDDAIDFLQSIKKTDPNAYKRLIKRLKD